jgi:uncharacterized protein (AIM24 family)
MKHTISGTTMPVLQMQLEAGEKIIAEPGEFSWMTENIQLHTTTQTAGARGLFSVLGRVLAGGGLFMTEYSAYGGSGMVAFSAKVPGTIQEVEVGYGHSYMIHKHGFLCATEGAQLSIGFQRGLGAGLFIGRLTGPGKVWLQSMTVPGLAHAIAPYLSGEEATSDATGTTAGVVAASFLKDIFRS